MEEFSRLQRQRESRINGTAIAIGDEKSREDFRLFRAERGRCSPVFPCSLSLRLELWEILIEVQCLGVGQGVAIQDRFSVNHILHG